MLLFLSSVINLRLLVGFCAACMLSYRCLQMKCWAAVTWLCHLFPACTIDMTECSGFYCQIISTVTTGFSLFPAPVHTSSFTITFLRTLVPRRQLILIAHLASFLAKLKTARCVLRCHRDSVKTLISFASNRLDSCLIRLDVGFFVRRFSLIRFYSDQECRCSFLSSSIASNKMSALGVSTRVPFPPSSLSFFSHGL